MQRTTLFALTAIAMLPSSTGADVAVITDQAEWRGAVGSYNTITFTDYPEFTTITNQYESLGINFTDGNDFIFETGSFPSDAHGLVSSDGFGNPGTIHMAFSEPHYWLAFDFIGHLQIELYSEGQLLFTSMNYHAGFFPFLGVVSTVPFDAAIVRDFSDDVVAIDNIHFGPPIPAPGAMALIGLAAALFQRRTRCDS